MGTDAKTQAMRDEATKLMAVRVLAQNSSPELSALEKELGVNAVTINNDEGKTSAPTLNALFDVAKNYAANHSEIDYPVKNYKVVLVNNGNLSDLSNFSDHMVDHKKKLIVLPLSVVNNQSYDQLTANMGHEYIHTGERRPDNKNITTRGNEALADRGGAPGIKTLDAHLSYVQLDSRTYTFDEPDHPTLRSRIEMDLRRTYGDDVFKGQVNYDTKNSKITPTEFNGVPVTERGYSVTNWKTEISPAIEKQIAADMKALDKVVQDKDGLQPAERLKFLEDVEKYASQLQNQHQPKTEINLNYHAHLADLFKKSMEDKALLPSVIKMHPDMPKAYQAYINILNETKDLEPNKRSQVIDSSVQTIAKNIAAGNFPNIEITTPQLRQPPIAPEVSSQER